MGLRLVRLYLRYIAYVYILVSLPYIFLVSLIATLPQERLNSPLPDRIVLKNEDTAMDNKLQDKAIFLNESYKNPTVRVYLERNDSMSYIRDPKTRSDLRIKMIKHRCELLNITEAMYKFDTARFFVDHKHKVLYCPIGETGNTAWRGKLLQMSDRGRKSYKKDAKFRAGNLGNEYLKSIGIRRFHNHSQEKKGKMFNTYKRFMLVRDPLERLISGHKHLGRGVSLAKFAAQLMNPTNKLWKTCDTLPSITCCNPCFMDYHFIGHFDNYVDDSYYILKEFFNETELVFTDAPHATHTNKAVARRLIGGLPDELKLQLFKYFFVDMYLFSSDDYSLEFLKPK